MIHSEVTSAIIEACFEVSNELGIGYLESVYEKSLAIALRQKGLIVEMQVPLNVRFRGVTVGDFYADIVVEHKVIVELKAASSITKEHYAQLLNYLKATGFEVGLVVNFGTTRIQYRRFENRFGELTSSAENIDGASSDE